MEKIKEFVYKHRKKIVYVLIALVVIIAFSSCQGLVPLNSSDGNMILVGHDQSVMEVFDEI